MEPDTAGIDARIVADGALEIRRHEMGAADFAEWGADDRETTLRIEARDVPRLLLALLADSYAGRPDALEAVRAVCKAQGVPAKFNEWT